MRFKCGKTIDEIEAWHDFFCLFPRDIGGSDCRWLEVVERKGRWIDWPVGWTWEYRSKT